MSVLCTPGIIIYGTFPRWLHVGLDPHSEAPISVQDIRLLAKHEARHAWPIFSTLLGGLECSQLVVCLLKHQTH